jgi:hypothetical protein
MNSSQTHPKILIRVASVISIVFHPVFVFFYLFTSLILFTSLFPEIKYYHHIGLILLFLAVNSIILPIILIIIINKNLLLAKKTDRTAPLLIMIVLYAFILFFFYKTGLPGIFTRFIYSIILCLLLLLFFNRFLKISLHAAAMGAALGLLVQLYYYFPSEIFFLLFSVFIISGITGAARLISEAHNPKELFLGYGLGFISSVLTFWI